MGCDVNGRSVDVGMSMPDVNTGCKYGREGVDSRWEEEDGMG